MHFTKFCLFDLVATQLSGVYPIILGGTPYKGDSAQKGYLFRLQVYKRVGISSVEVQERLGKFVISVCKRTKKG